MPAAGEIDLASGATDMPGWTVGGGGLRIVSDLYWVPSQGARSISLNRTGAGSITQTFATAPGATYRLGFKVSGEPFTTPAFKHLRVSAAGQSAEYSYDIEPAWHWDMAWAEHEWTFTANAATTTLTLESLDPGANGPALDSVDVSFLTAGAADVPSALSLAPVSPNPARGGADVAFALPRAADVRVGVLDVQGREVASLARGERAAGVHRLRWNAGSAAPGLYFVTLAAEGRVLVRRVTLAR